MLNTYIEYPKLKIVFENKSNKIKRNFDFILANMNITTESQKTDFLNTLNLVGTFDKDFFLKTLNYIKNMNNIINIKNIKDKDLKKNFLNYFNNGSELLQWIVITTQINFYNRFNLVEEKQNTSLSDKINTKNIKELYKKLNTFALQKKIDLNREHEYEFAFILGGTYRDMETKYNFIMPKNQDKLKINEKIIFLTGSRVIDLSQINMINGELAKDFDKLKEKHKGNKNNEKTAESVIMDEVSQVYFYLKQKFLSKNQLTSI